jgi:hypothetical protein
MTSRARSRNYREHLAGVAGGPAAAMRPARGAPREGDSPTLALFGTGRLVSECPSEASDLSALELLPDPAAL